MDPDRDRIDTLPMAASGGRHSAFLAVRNESLRLPYVLEYHRGIGVDRFFVVDNGSTDGTAEFLLAQPDVHVFRTEESFAASSCGMDWLNALLARYGVGDWCLFLDADELFVYPGVETVGLPRFCQYLDSTNAEGVFAVMLDMYGDRPIEETSYRAGTPFLDTCPFFDSAYQLRRRFMQRSSADLSAYELVGGPRIRCLYPELNNAGPIQLAVLRSLRRLRRHPVGQMLGLQRTDLGKVVPSELTKVPLLKGRPGVAWLGNHRATGIRLATVTAALLHFKFFSDFHARALVEASRAEHWDSAAEYRRYCIQLQLNPGLRLWHSGSLRYLSSYQLISLGLIRTSGALAELGPVLGEFDGEDGFGRASNEAPSLVSGGH